LSIPCQECGFANEPAERYCGGCGHTLGGDETIVAIEPERTTDPEGDRRPVTVLFCDLVGYTHLSSVMDPEDVHGLLERFFALVDATVDRFGGTIDKHIGDAAMALFGAPLARGNDAERAVRAALEIQTSVPKLASGLAAALAVHIGIATGEVIASSVGSQHHRGYTVTGEAANIAARLLEKATRGETLVSDDVYQATNHVVSYEPLGPLALKGVGHPVEAWRPTGIRSSAPEAHALVGRRSELGQFRAVLDACVNGDTGTALLIRGEAGIGKTRLMDELQSIAAASNMSCTAGFVLDFGTARGHGAVRTVVAGLLGLGSEATPDVAERAMDLLLKEGRLQADDLLYLRDLLEMPQPEATLKLLDRNVLSFVGSREQLRRLGQSTRKGILLYGPPGTGKTHTIRYLASNLPGHTTLIITAAQIALLAHYMSLARLLQPAMVVIEDVDLIARDREQMGPCDESLLNGLLNEMDGLKQDADILFILTTNRPEQLESALAASTRPSRCRYQTTSAARNWSSSMAGACRSAMPSRARPLGAQRASARRSSRS